MGGSLPAPRSSSDEERTLVVTRSRRKWIWMVGDEAAWVEVAEFEEWVFASGRGTGAGEAFECTTGNLSDFDSEVGIAAAAGWSAEPENKLEFEVGFGFGVVVQTEDMEMTALRSGTDIENVIVTETAGSP